MKRTQENTKKLSTIKTYKKELKIYINKDSNNLSTYKCLYLKQKKHLSTLSTF